MPPIAGPMVAPVDHAIGMNAYACAMFVESVISASILFITPMLPFKAPFRLRLTTAPQNVRERPKQYMDIDKPIRPVMNTGLRPTWSEILLQCMTVRACVA